MTGPQEPPHVCVVVAHPDDEALWFGAGLLRMRAAGARVTAVSLTNANNRVRGGEFHRLCEEVGATPVMLDYPDGGREQFPEYPEELSSSVDVAKLSCVVTHSPLGQERSHPQHVQTWNGVRAWTLDHEIPLAFFAERRLTELAAGRRVLAATTGARLRHARLSRGWLAERSARAIRDFPRERIALDNLRHTVRLRRRQFAGVRHVIDIDVDVASKAALFDLYPSQMPGLTEYATAFADREYVYADGLAGWRLMEALTCRSS
jgi:LmbE family N-acetylglucosaminyl deacetylase